MIYLTSVTRVVDDLRDPENATAASDAVRSQSNNDGVNCSVTGVTKDECPLTKFGG